MTVPHGPGARHHRALPARRTSILAVHTTNTALPAARDMVGSGDCRNAQILMVSSKTFQADKTAGGNTIAASKAIKGMQRLDPHRQRLVGAEPTAIDWNCDTVVFTAPPRDSSTSTEARSPSAPLQSEHSLASAAKPESVCAHATVSSLGRRQLPIASDEPQPLSREHVRRSLPAGADFAMRADNPTMGLTAIQKNCYEPLSPKSI